MVPCFRFESVCLEAVAVNLPPNEISSAELESRLAPLYQRLGIPPGTLERLSGIGSRFVWDRKVLPSEVSTEAAKLALEKVSIAPEHIQALFNCSVTRDFFEPATACIVHRNLGLPETCMAMDITNACVGFSNGLVVLANMIESGAVKAGVIVSGETVAPMLESTVKQLAVMENITREELLKVLPTFTIGSGSVAYVLCHESLSKTKHKIIGAVARSQTAHSDLCSGNGDYELSGHSENAQPMMITESAKLISSAASLGKQMFKDFSASFGWKKEDIQHIFCHQVGRQVNSAFYEEMGLDYEKEFTIYRKYGNLVSAALPTALALGIEKKTQDNTLNKKDKILLSAFGSGLNSIFIGIEW